MLISNCLGLDQAQAESERVCEGQAGLCGPDLSFNYGKFLPAFSGGCSKQHTKQSCLSK